MVYGKNGKITASCQTAVVVQIVQTIEYRGRSVAANKNTIYEIRTGEVQHLLGNGAAFMLEEKLSILPE